MSLWMEIRCDLNLSASCWDVSNRMVSFGDFNRSSVVKRARQRGWEVDRDGSARCPACLPLSTPTDGEKR